MKVLTYTSLFPNALFPQLGIFILNRMKAWSAMPGNELVVVAPVPMFPIYSCIKKYSKIPKEETICGLKVYHPRYFHIPLIGLWFQGLFMYLSTREFCIKLHKEYKFDLIDSHFFYPDVFSAALIGKDINVPIVGSARGSDINVYAHSKVVRFLLKKVFESVNGNIFVSEGLKEKASKICKKMRLVTTIANGVNSKDFYYVEKKMAREILGLDENKIILISVGNFIKKKQHDFLISAVSVLEKLQADFELYLIGDGPQRVHLLRQINKNKLEKKVFLISSKKQNELRNWYCSADLFCLPSRSEGYPNVICEALACGTPVLATKVGGIPEIVSSDELGVLVDGTIASIEEGIKIAFVKKWDREKISLHGRVRTWEQVAKDVTQIFEEVLASK